MTIEHVAIYAGLSLNAVRRAFVNLREEGVVQIVGRRRVGNSRPWNLYLLCTKESSVVMSINAPIGVIADSAVKLASEISRRRRSSNCTVLAWAEHGDVFAQDVSTRAAKRIEREKPHLIIGLYTKAAKVRDIEADVMAMQLEVAA